MSAVEHAKPVDLDGLARVLFELEDRTFGEAEVLWAESLSAETARLDNIPLLVFGVSKGDVVRGSRDGAIPRFLGVAERGGHSTYRVRRPTVPRPKHDSERSWSWAAALSD